MFDFHYIDVDAVNGGCYSTTDGSVDCAAFQVHRVGCDLHPSRTLSEKLVILTHLVFDVITVLSLSAIVLQRRFSLVTFSFAQPLSCANVTDVCVARDDRGLVVESLLGVSAFVPSQCRLIGASTVRRATVLDGSMKRAPSVIHRVARSS